MKKKLFVGAALCCTLLLGSNPARAANPETEVLLDLLQDKGVISRGDAESFRQTVEKTAAEKEGGGTSGLLFQKINERVALSGVVEVEAASAEDFAGADTSDITLATVELDLDVEISEWVNAHLLLLWEEDDTERVDLDEGTITLGNPEKFPLYLTAGKMYVPFGAFESNMISDPLTLELGETRESAALVGFETSGFYGSFYAFNGDVNETGDDDAITSFGANAGYGFENDQLSLDLGVGWINNIAAADVLSEYFGAGTEVQDYAAGITTHLTVNYGPFMLIGEYLGALDAFDASELDFNGSGAEPSAWNVEAAYTREIKGKETAFAVGYQKTDEALALELPEERILATIGVGIWENTSLALEYLHDEDYSVADGGTGNDANVITLQLAVEF